VKIFRGRGGGSGEPFFFCFFFSRRTVTSLPSFHVMCVLIMSEMERRKPVGETEARGDGLRERRTGRGRKGIVPDSVLVGGALEHDLALLALVVKEVRLGQHLRVSLHVS
jgi:hypothetical protein